MRNALWLDSLNIDEEPRDFEIYGRIRCRCSPANTVEHCLKCGVPADRLYKHGATPKRYADLPAHGRHFYICVWVQRYRCRECGGTFDHPLPEMDETRKMTNRCVAYDGSVSLHGRGRPPAGAARASEEAETEIGATMKPTDQPKGIQALVRYFDRDYWQMREALGYPMPYWVQRRWPRQFQDGGTNPYVCGSCEARRRYPELHQQRIYVTSDL